MTIIRHKLITSQEGGAACNCGYDPRIVLEESFDWTDAARAVVAHIKETRRWKYLGIEFHYGVGYYLWENPLSGRRWAITEYDYLALTGVLGISRWPRLQVSWTA